MNVLMKAATAVAASAVLSSGLSAPTAEAAEEAPAPAGSSVSSLSSGPEAAFDDVVNDPTCTPAPEHPEPVVLLHGTWGRASDFLPLAQRLDAAGYCVWALKYGLADLDVAAAEIAEGIADVKRATGAEKVDLIGHSQGGMQIKRYIATQGGQDVRRVATMGATFHGTTLDGADTILRPLIDALPQLSAFFASSAAVQQVVGSEQVKALDALPDTRAGIVYTSVFSPADVTATPNSTSHLRPVEGADVALVDVAQACGVAVEHPDMPGDATMAALMQWGLERPVGEQAPTAAACS